jgi:glycosyltransferase involved in cell wall biosynthesis
MLLNPTPRAQWRDSWRKFLMEFSSMRKTTDTTVSLKGTTSREEDVSVVMPVYNGSKYLHLSIESVLAQTHKNFELIICDDASTDDSVAIIEKYQDPRIRFFQNVTNRGLFPTLNFCIKNSCYEAIKIWTQDDIMKPHCLQTMLDFYQAHPEVGMIYSNISTMDETGNVSSEKMEDATPFIISPDLASRIMFYHGSIAGNISNTMLFKSVLEEAGCFREDMKVSGDFEMWVRLCEKRYFGRIDDPLIFLRDHNGQFSRKMGTFTIFMTENAPLYETMLKRLPSHERRYARRYHRYHRGVFYIHGMMKALFLRDWDTVRTIVNFLRQHYSLATLIFLWLFSANKRFFCLKSRYNPENLSA